QRRMFQNMPPWVQIHAQMQDQVATLLAEDSLSAMEFIDASADPKVQMEQYERIQQEREARLTQLMGADRYERYKEYQEGLGERMQLAQLNVDLGPAEMLKEDRIRPLVAAMVKAREATFGQLRENVTAQQGGADSDPAAAMERFAQAQR